MAPPTYVSWSAISSPRRVLSFDFRSGLDEDEAIYLPSNLVADKVPTFLKQLLEMTISFHVKQASHHVMPKGFVFKDVSVFILTFFLLYSTVPLIHDTYKCNMMDPILEALSRLSKDFITSVKKKQPKLAP
ncbi:hypothetical protein TNCT_155541 [Trichonephila clavata]|uniref:Uncharacterized protein n=1 Tax=Trichonephila clavata TaxID=2740835 RepID=A0A8X6LX71_TRICU|nr:hypothetical protein TNCT_155541 [Trichonephila clavata]